MSTKLHRNNHQEIFANLMFVERHYLCMKLQASELSQKKCLSLSCVTIYKKRLACNAPPCCSVRRKAVWTWWVLNFLNVVNKSLLLLNNLQLLILHCPISSYSVGWLYREVSISYVFQLLLFGTLKLPTLRNRAN